LPYGVIVRHTQLNKKDNTDEDQDEYAGARVDAGFRLRMRPEQ
jgi:hypothetical protein